MRRRAWLITLVLALPSIAPAEDMATETPSPPPAYKPMRFDENYLCLTNAANRGDWSDPLKYIPLRKYDPNWYLTFGGELRERVESVNDANFGIGAGSDSYWLQRVTLLSDLHLGERVRFFAEGISGVIEGERKPASPVQNDPIDLQFAFAEVTPWLTYDQRLTLRVGRFGMSFGAGRLVATRAAANIPSRFDGFELLYSRPAWEATAFLTEPVKDSSHFDSEDHSVTFWGLYLTHWFNAPRTIGADLYYLGIHREHGAYASGRGDEHRHSMGMREFGKWHHWNWDAEQVLQVGTFGNQSVQAWTAALDGGYAWDTALQPRLGLKAGITSGDRNPNDGRQETFDALFFKSGYFNDASLIRPQNIIGVHPNLALNLTKSVTTDGGVNFLWRYTKHDAVYTVPGFVSVPANQNASRYVATALDINLNWRIQRHISLGASYVHFFTGSYVHNAGGKDVDYFSTTMSFLF